MKNTYLTLVGILLAVAAQAQSGILDTTRSWISHENIQLYSGQTLTESFDLTLSNTQLTLSSDGVTRTFQVSNVSGIWSSILDEGQVTFNLSIGGLNGIGSFQNEDGVLSVIVDFSQRKDGMKKKFIIEN